MCTLCPQGWDPRTISRSPTAKAEVRGEERIERREGSRTGHKGTVCEQGDRWKAGTGYAVLLYVGRERSINAGVKDDRVVSEGMKVMVGR